MKNYFKTIAILLYSIACIQCTDENISTKASEIGLELQNENNFTGKLIVNSHNISYVVNSPSELNFIMSLEIDKKLIDASINYENESIDINGYDTVLSENQKEALLKMGQLISEYILSTKGGDISMTEYTLLSMTEYLGKSPNNYIYSKRKITSSGNTNTLKSRNEGITCIRKNTYVNAEYDDSRGNHSDRVKVGSKPRNNYGCMGRCGGDCGRWWIPSAWTKDCMDHDQCSNINNASGGGSDRNCGDEFNEAADDYVFGVIRGCRG
ncbi:hypothetical protein [uncultured Aquimarina sp.]|uniref:hypothetical protein n=1 Tax=uncultured Aquimarina sp. TaxID=575652 RepID=UPI002623BA54|nr:hypothetical protein [uncultured Aquimarina sp.]